MIRRLTLLVAGLALAGLAAAQTVPAPGTSARIDAIKKAGVLRAAVLSNPPWLVENTTGSGDQWAGPAWLLAVASSCSRCRSRTRPRCRCWPRTRPT